MFRASTVLLPLRWVVWCLWVAWLSLRVIAEASCGVKNSLFLGNIPTSTSWTLGCFESGVMLGFTTLFGEPFFPERPRSYTLAWHQRLFQRVRWLGRRGAKWSWSLVDFPELCWFALVFWIGWQSLEESYQLNLGHTYLKLEGSRDGVCGWKMNLKWRVVRTPFQGIDFVCLIS